MSGDLEQIAARICATTSSMWRRSDQRTRITGKSFQLEVSSDAAVALHTVVHLFDGVSVPDAAVELDGNEGGSAMSMK